MNIKEKLSLWWNKEEKWLEFNNWSWKTRRIKMADENISKRFSFDGWKFWTAIKGTVKQFVEVGVPLFVVWWATSSPYWGALAGIVGKFVLGAVEYFIKEY